MCCLTLNPFSTKNLEQLLSFARCHFGLTSPLKYQLLKLWTSSRNFSFWKNWRLILLLNLCPLIMSICWHSCIILLFISDGMCSYFNLYNLHINHATHRMWYMPCHVQAPLAASTIKVLLLYYMFSSTMPSFSCTFILPRYMFWCYLRLFSFLHYDSPLSQGQTLLTCNQILLSCCWIAVQICPNANQKESHRQLH